MTLRLVSRSDHYGCIFLLHKLQLLLNEGTKFIDVPIFIVLKNIDKNEPVSSQQEVQITEISRLVILHLMHTKMIVSIALQDDVPLKDHIDKSALNLYLHLMFDVQLL